MKTHMAILIFLFTLQLGQASACPFQSYLDVENVGPSQSNPSTYVSDRMSWKNQLAIVFQDDVKSFFKLYSKNKLTEADLACIQSSGRLKDQIENNFSSLFIIEAAQKMTASRSEAIRAFASKISKLTTSGIVIPIKLHLHLDRNSTSERPAGFDRNTRGVFFNLFQINSSDYSVYLIHEFAHAFDPELNSAIDLFNDSALTETIASFVRAKASYESLSNEQKHQVDRYVLAGLNRGLLAELRAWVTTSELYLELLRHQEQKPVDFLDPILGSSRDLNRSQLTQIWWDYLLKNFTRPNEGLFASPLLQSAVESALKQSASSLL